MNERICIIAFIFSQLVFLPSYIKCTKLITGNKKLGFLGHTEYTILSPLSAYVLSSIIFALAGRYISSIEIMGADMIMCMVSAIYVIIYQRIASKRGSRVLSIYIYVSFFIFQTSFTYIFENIWFIIFEQIILTTVLSIAIYKITEKYVRAIDQSKLEMTSENRSMLIIPFAVTMIRLTQSVAYSVMANSEKYETLWLNRFSAYNAVIDNVILIIVVYFTGIMFNAIAKQTQLAVAAKKYQKLSEQSLYALVKAIEAKDMYTKGHSIRVAEYSEKIAKKLGYSDRDARDIYTMALVHDIGKIGITDTIINKAGGLTNREFDEIKQHPKTGAEILQEVDAFEKMSEIAFEHHEREDGKGYPRGLKGDEISEEVAIVSVADAYDAMTSRRSYRDIMSQKDVLLEIEKGINKQFKKRPAEAMIEIIKEDKNYELHQK